MSDSPSPPPPAPVRLSLNSKLQDLEHDLRRQKAGVVPARPPPRPQLTWPVLALLAGVTLTFVLPLLVSLAPARTYWSDTDQAQFQKASAEYHAASYNQPSSADTANLKRRGPDRIDPVAAKRDLEAKRLTWEAQKARLAAAQSRPSWIIWTLRLTGMLAAAAGVYGYIRGQSVAADSSAKLR